MVFSFCIKKYEMLIWVYEALVKGGYIFKYLFLLNRYKDLLLGSYM